MEPLLRRKEALLQQHGACAACESGSSGETSSVSQTGRQRSSPTHLCPPQGSGGEMSASQRGWKVHKEVSLAARLSPKVSDLVARPLQLSPPGLAAQALHQPLQLNR